MQVNPSSINPLDPDKSSITMRSEIANADFLRKFAPKKLEDLKLADQFINETPKGALKNQHQVENRSPNQNEAERTGELAHKVLKHTPHITSGSHRPQQKHH